MALSKLRKIDLREDWKHEAADFTNWLAVGLCLVSTVSCGDEPNTGPADRLPANLSIVSGNGQTGVAGEQLEEPLIAAIMDTNGAPVQGVSVRFAVTGGGGSMFVETASTDQNGLAQDRWTLGISTSDTQSVEARAIHGSTGDPLSASFAATVIPAAVSSLSKATGDLQTGPAGRLLPDSLAIRVVDVYGNPVPEVAVAWHVVSGGGTVSPSLGRTDATGIACAAWDLGNRLNSPQAVEARVGSFSPLSFSADATLPSQLLLSSEGGDAQTSAVAEALENSLVVSVKLIDARPLIGAPVKWEVTSGGGAVAPSNVLSDTLGNAATSWTLGPAVGEQTARAVVGGSEPVSFGANGIPRPPMHSPQIAFNSFTPDGANEVFLVGADGSGLLNLTGSPGTDYEPNWSPDGERIAFISNRDGNSEVYLMNADGSGLANLTNHSAPDGEARWSPDGSRIAFQSFRSTARNIYVVPPDGSRLDAVTDFGGGSIGGFGWSADASQIVFDGVRGGNWDIYVSDVEGGRVLQLTNHPESDRDPRWSPTGSQICFTSFRDGNWEIYSLNPDGSGLQNLTNNLAGDFVPTWSHDGSQIAFASEREGSTDLYVMSADGGDIRRVTSGTEIVSYPSWSPDDQLLAFTSRHLGPSYIFVVSVQGSGLTNVTPSTADNDWPVWRP